LLTVDSRTQLHDAYESSGPYKHGVLHPLCEEASLRGCFQEMQTHLTGTFKETDLFKVSAAVLCVHVCVCVCVCGRAASPGRETGRKLAGGSACRSHTFSRTYLRPGVSDG
jgi:hypothetical protein